MKTPTKPLCKFWQFEDFQAADRKFDAGEFSAAGQQENPYEQCGACEGCIENCDDGPNGGSPDAPAPHTDRAEPAWVAMAATLQRELRAAHVAFTCHGGQGGDWVQIALPGDRLLDVYYTDNATGADEYVLVVHHRVAAEQGEPGAHVANFQPAYASTVACLAATFARHGVV